MGKQLHYEKQRTNILFARYTFRNKYPNIPFKQIAGMRDKLIHDYFGVDYEIVWKTIKDKLPQFSGDIKMLIESLTK